LIKQKNILDDFQIANQLRDSVYKNTIWDENILRINAKQIYKFYESGKIYLYYKKNQGGGRCDNIAYFYQQILNNLGYRNYTYHFGNLNSYNHVINLIEIKIKNKEKLIVEDATYNLNFLNEENEPLDFFSLLKHVKEGKIDKIRISYYHKKRKILNS